MKVLFVVHGFPPVAEAGSEIYADTLARALRTHAGDDVTVFTREADRTRPEYAIREYVRDGIRVIAVNNTFRNVRSFEESYTHPKIAEIFAAILSELRPDVAHVHHLTCLSTLIPERLSAAAVPFVFTLHDYWMLCHRGQLLDREGRCCDGPLRGCTNCVGPTAVAPPIPAALAPAAAAIARYAPGAAAAFARASAMLVAADSSQPVEMQRLRHTLGALSLASRVLAPSTALLDRFVAAGLDAGRSEVWELGFDRRAFTTRTNGPSPSGPLRVGFVGTLMLSKAPHLLLEAVDGLPPDMATVDLYGEIAAYHGDDTYRAVLARWRQVPWVRFHGHVPHTDMRVAFEQMDVLVVTSIWPENSPLVIREAFLAGVVVVAPRIGGIPELVHHDVNGLLYEPGDIEGLRAALRRLSTEAGLLGRLASHRTPVRAVEDDAQATHALYAAVVEARRQAPLRNDARVHAVVLNYHTPDQTLMTVRSLLSSGTVLANTTVIDNSGSTECARTLADVSERVAYVAMPRNLGFAGGANMGIERAMSAGATHVLLVNSDVTVPPDAVSKALRALASAPDAGIAGARVLDRRRPDLVESNGIAFDRRTGRMRLRDYGARDEVGESSGRVVEAVPGCFLLVDRDTLQRCERMAGGYFFGFEDVEFCLRAATFGRRTIVSDAVVYHEGGGSLAASSTDRLYYAARNHLTLAAGLGARGRGLRLASVLLLNVASALRASPLRWPARLAAVGMGALDAARSATGPRRP